MEVIYSIYNRHRLPEFQIETNIIEENGQKKVIKKAITKEAYPHIEDIYKNYFKLKDTIINKNVKLPEILKKKDNFISFEFIEGKNFDKILFEAFLNKNEDEYFKLLDEYYKVLSISFKIVDKLFIPLETENIFKSVNLDLLNNEKKYYLLSYLDPVLSNIIIRDNSYYLIDNEWTLEGNLPVSFIFFRGLLSFYNKHRFEEVLLNRIFKYYKFPDKLIQVYYDMEKDFQYHVYGENLQNKNKYLKKVEKIKDIKKLIEEKDKEIKNQSNWINICQEEVKKRDENVRLLQKEFEEKEKWIAICQEEIKKRDDNTKSLLNTLEDKANYINFLIIQLIEKEAHINTLTHEITEKKSHINNLNHQLTEWNYQITEKETHINNLNHQLTEVYNNIKIASTTKAWKLMCFIRRIKEQLLAGNMGQKKSFLKWIKNKLLKQTVPEELALARFSPINFIPQFFVPAENKLTPRKKIEKTENSSVNVSDNKGSSVQTYDVIFFSIMGVKTE
ncbi:MAG: Chromosome partition protein Smc [bacterium ADurb.Bin363]|nr:MAG: Chromosome partition protein Smc [bacterium ADurb.Bin363]